MGKKIPLNHVQKLHDGVSDGIWTAGNERQSPPFPEEAKPGTLVYAATLFAQEMYNKGFKIGKEVGE